MIRKIVLTILFLSMLSIASAELVEPNDVINKTKFTYNPTILPDSPLYNVKLALERWQVNYSYLVVPNNESERINRTIAFVERRIIDTQRMIFNGADSHAINNSIGHMQIALMKLDGVSKDDIREFRREINNMYESSGRDHRTLMNDTKAFIDVEEKDALQKEVNEIRNRVHNQSEEMEAHEIEDDIKELNENVTKYVEKRRSEMNGRGV